MSTPLSINAPRRALLVYFALVTILSWALWIPSLLAAEGLITFPVPYQLAQLLGAWMPGIVSILLSVFFARWNGLRQLLRRLALWRVGLRWYLFALFWPALLSLLATGFSLLLGAPMPDFANPPVTSQYPLPPEAYEAGFLALLPVVFTIQFFGSSLGEELGWRGFALPRLQARQGALLSSLILGILWGLWSLPRFWTPSADFLLSEYLLFLTGICLDSILFTWLFNNTHGSLLPVSLYHTTLAVTLLFLASSALPWVTLLLQALLVAGIIARSGSIHLTRQPTRMLA